MYQTFIPQETDVLLGHNVVENKRKGVLAYIIGGAALIGALFAVTRSDTMSNIYTNSVKTSTMLESVSTVFNVSVSSPGYDQLLSLTMLPWDQIAEPNKVQIISLDNFTIDGESVDLENYDVNWTLAEGLSLTGSFSEFIVTSTGVYKCSVAIWKPGEDKTYTHEFTMAVKYVRREIRTMSDDDRTTFFDALSLMYNTDSDKGNELYGDKFHTAEYFLKKHMTGAAVSDW